MTAPVDVAVLCWRQPGVSEHRARRVAEFFGIEDAQPIVLTPQLCEGIRSRPPALSPRTCLLVDAETLASVVDANPAIRLDDVIGVAKHVFVYGFRPTARHANILERLSSGAFGGIRANDGAEFRVEHLPDWCGPFAGLSFAAPGCPADGVFIGETTSVGSEAIIRAGAAPFFVRCQRGGVQVFLVACGELVDLDEAVGRGWRPLAWFSRLMPIAMFLRGVLGDRIWHAPQPRACFIIDDPLLKERHGFLEHRRLIDAIGRSGGSVSIAFIPWNCRRTVPAIAALYQSRSGASLCVHGCDHTNGEFNSADLTMLLSRASLALERMREHARLSGLPFDDVMVFPQGLFSKEALAALRKAGYLAALNSDLCPSSDADGLPLADALDVAVTRFDDFPLFGRRYPIEPAEFAFDLFLGKPAIAVEHHEFFRHGYGALERFVNQLDLMEPRLEWTDLGRICSRACLTRTDAKGNVRVRFYTSRFSLTNTEARPRDYILTSRAIPAGCALTVTVDDRQHASCSWSGGEIRLSLTPGETVHIQAAIGEATAAAPDMQSHLHRANVRLRRCLCEFRDNHIDTSRALSALARSVRLLRSGATGNLSAIAARRPTSFGPVREH